MRKNTTTEKIDPLLIIAGFGFLAIFSSILFYSISLFVGASSTYFLKCGANVIPIVFVGGIIMSAGIILSGIKFVDFFKKDKRPLSLIIFIGSLVAGVFNTLMYSLFWFILRNTLFYIMFGVSFYCLATYLNLYGIYFNSVSNSTKRPKFTLILSDILIVASGVFLVFITIFVGTAIMWYEETIALRIISIYSIILEPPLRDVQRLFSIFFLICGGPLFIFASILFSEGGWKEATGRTYFQRTWMEG